MLDRREQLEMATQLQLHCNSKVLHMRKTGPLRGHYRPWLRLLGGVIAIILLLCGIVIAAYFVASMPHEQAPYPGPVEDMKRF